MTGINSNLQFSLPNLPVGIDPVLAQLLTPLHLSVLGLFAQLSEQLGQTYVEPALYSSIPVSSLAKLNGLRKIYKKNTTGSTIDASTFVYLKSDDTIAPSGTTSATAPIGFVTGAVLNDAFAEVVLSVGYLSSSGLTPGAKYQAGAAGALTAFTTGPAIAIALSDTALYVNIPLY